MGLRRVSKQLPSESRYRDNKYLVAASGTQIVPRFLPDLFPAKFVRKRLKRLCNLTRRPHRNCDFQETTLLDGNFEAETGSQ
jgi:hypothetical protein